MYENKVLVKLYVLSLDKEFEVYIPINDKIGNITRLLNTTMFDSINYEKNNSIMNIDTGVIYKNNTIIRDTDIKNRTKLILF